MSNVALYSEKPSGFLRVGKDIPLPAVPQFLGICQFPSWVHYFRETQKAFADITENNIGDLDVVPCSCGYGWNRGWDMNPTDLLHLAGQSRNPMNSRLHLGEVLLILCLDRLGNLEEVLPSPFYFIVEGWSDTPHLLEIRRKNQFGYRITGSSEISKKSRIPRQKPLFIPRRPR